jgi:hypothetical protein
LAGFADVETRYRRIPDDPGGDDDQNQPPERNLAEHSASFLSTGYVEIDAGKTTDGTFIFRPIANTLFYAIGR